MAKVIWVLLKLCPNHLLRDQVSRQRKMTCLWSDISGGDSMSGVGVDNNELDIGEDDNRLLYR